MITAVLLNWKRPDNMPAIIRALELQVDAVVLVNCVGGSQETFGLEKVVTFPWNPGPVARLLVASQVQTEWVLLHDDDLIVTDRRLVDRAIRCAEAHSHSIVGAWGRGVRKEHPHYWPEVRHGEAAIIKTRFLVLPTRLLHGVRMPPKEARFADDLWLSLETGRGAPVHWVESGLRKGLAELPKGDVGLEERPDHYESRHQFVKWYLDTWAEATTRA